MGFPNPFDAVNPSKALDAINPLKALDAINPFKKIGEFFNKGKNLIDKGKKLITLVIIMVIVGMIGFVALKIFMKISSNKSREMYQSYTQQPYYY